MFDFLMDAYSHHPHDRNIKRIVNSHRFEIIKAICQSNQVTMLRRILKAGVDVKPFGYMYLQISASGGFKELFHLLLDNGARPDNPRNGFFTLQSLVEHQDLESVRRVVNAGLVDPRLPLHGGHEFLNQRDGFESTTVPINLIEGANLLHFAVLAHSFEIVRELIQWGVDVHARTDGGDTPYTACLDSLKELHDENKELEDDWNAIIEKCKRRSVLECKPFSDILKLELHTDETESELKEKIWQTIKVNQQKIDQLRLIQELLKQHGVDVQVTKRPIEQCRQHRYFVMGIITGLNQDNEQAVVLGRKRLKDDAIEPDYVFPGGFKGTEDESFYAAAVREVEEETGLPLSRLLADKKASHKRLYQLIEAGADNNVHYHLEIFHFDLGQHLKDYEVYAYDDLAVVEITPIKRICRDDREHIVDQYSVTTDQGSVKLRASNGLAISLLQGFDTHQALRDVLMVECDAHHMMCYAAKVGNITELERLYAHHVMPRYHEETSSSPLFSACNHGQLNALRWLVEHGVNLNEGYFLMLKPAKQNDFAIIRYLLSLPHLPAMHVSSALMLSDCSPEMARELFNDILQRARAHTVILNDYSSGGQISHIVSGSFQVAIQYGFREIADELLSHWSFDAEAAHRWHEKSEYTMLEEHGWHDIAHRLAIKEVTSRLFDGLSFETKFRLPPIQIYQGENADHLHIKISLKKLPDKVKLNKKLIPHIKGSWLHVDRATMRCLFRLSEDISDAIFNLLFSHALPRTLKPQSMADSSAYAFFQQALPPAPQTDEERVEALIKVGWVF
jgi:8-oxo-dGTP pyrophosphatase MutT (NUDIX family)